MATAYRLIDVAVLVGALRREARRCRTEIGYRAPPGSNRQQWAAALSVMARKIEKRRDLRLSLDYWMQRGQGMLRQ